MYKRDPSLWIATICSYLLICPMTLADNESLRSYLQTRSVATDFSGAVLVKSGSEIVLRDAYGFAERELDIPLTPEAIMRIGSLTKPITATGILFLEEAGRLALGDSVCSFLQACPATWKAVTIRSLLNHTSGIPDYFGHLEAVPVEDTVTEVNALIGDIGTPELESEPGGTYAYSNFNYVLLGYAIEKYSEMHWQDFLIDTMFDPIGMNNTRYDDVWALVPGRARGYTTRHERVANIEYDDHAAYAAGGLRSTLDDLEKWHRAYVNDQIISTDSRARATAAGLGDYGLGWQVLTMFGRSMYNHTGAIDGFTSHLAFYPDDELLIIVLSNSDREDAKATACDLAALAFEVVPLPTGDRTWLSRPRDERCRSIN